MPETLETAQGRLLSIPQAAELANVSRVTIWRRVRAGELPAIVVGSGRGPIRIREDEFRAWLFGDAA